MSEAIKYLNNVSMAETGDDLETIETVTISEATHAVNLAKVELLEEIVLKSNSLDNDYDAYDIINQLLSKYKKLV